MYYDLYNLYTLYNLYVYMNRTHTYMYMCMVESGSGSAQSDCSFVRFNPTGVAMRSCHQGVFKAGLSPQVENPGKL